MGMGPPLGGGAYPRKVGPLSHMGSALFFPEKADNLFFSRPNVYIYTPTQNICSTFRRQNSVVKKFAVGRGRGSSGSRKPPPMVQPTQWLIRHVYRMRSISMMHICCNTVSMFTFPVAQCHRNYWHQINCNWLAQQKYNPSWQCNAMLFTISKHCSVSGKVLK